jgi:hypothetical protein
VSGKFDCFCEGKTEENVLAALGLSNYPRNTNLPTGKQAVRDRLKNLLGPKLGSEPVRALILLDVDLHMGETAANVKQSVEDTLKNLWRERDFEPNDLGLAIHAVHPNLYCFQANVPDARIALHLAARRYDEQFIKATIDDYVLDLALRKTTADAMLADKRVDETNRNEQYKGDARPPREWQIEAAGLAQKVWEEIPALLKQNQIPPLQEAKSFLQFYTAVLQEPLPTAAFAKQVVKHARQEDRQEVFAALFAAAQFLNQEAVSA